MNHFFLLVIFFNIIHYFILLYSVINKTVLNIEYNNFFFYSRFYNDNLLYIYTHMDKK